MTNTNSISIPVIPELPFRDAAGGTIPQLGFGTYKVAPETAQQTVETALELGYRHIDTAQMYHNEAEVGAALRASGIPRDEIFLTTKLDNPNHAEADARRSLEESLEKLQTDYVDLFLIHWPMPDSYDGKYPDCWRLLLEFREAGLVRHVGVSNFQVSHLQRLLDEVGEFPAVNQIEVHPWLANNEVRDFTKAHGGIIEAWSPLARGRYFDGSALQGEAKRLDCTPAQLVLRWAIDRGDVVFPKSNHRERMQENLDCLRVKLDAEATVVLDGLDRGEAGRTGSHPDKVNWLRK